MLDDAVTENEIRGLVINRPTLARIQYPKFVNGGIVLADEIDIETDNSSNSPLKALQISTGAHWIFIVLTAATSKVDDNGSRIDKCTHPCVKSDRPITSSEPTKINLRVELLFVFIHSE
jgi:hypothetical protein